MAPKRPPLGNKAPVVAHAPARALAPLCLPAPRDVNRVNEEWFSDVEAVRKAVGVLEEPAPDKTGPTGKVRLRGVCARREGERRMLADEQSGWAFPGALGGSADRQLHGAFRHAGRLMPQLRFQNSLRSVLDERCSPTDTRWPPPQPPQCLICFDDFPKAAMRCAPCRHYFCSDCWRGYVANAISCGPACLDLRCPLPECKIAVRIADGPVAGRGTIACRAAIAAA